jgi:hypothetical protein
MRNELTNRVATRLERYKLEKYLLLSVVKKFLFDSKLFQSVDVSFSKFPLAVDFDWSSTAGRNADSNQ